MNRRSVINLYHKRLAAYLLLGLALALALPPWYSTDAKYEYLTRPGVFLSALALGDPALGLACGTRIHELDSDALDAYPVLSRVLAGLEGVERAGQKVHFRSAGPKSLANQLGREKAQSLCFRLNGETYLLKPQKPKDILSSSLVKVGILKQAAYSSPELDKFELEKHPYLKSYLEELQSRLTRHQEWNRELVQLKKELNAKRDSKIGGDLANAIKEFDRISLTQRIRSRQWDVRRESLEHTPFFLELLSPTPYEEWKRLLDKLGGESGKFSLLTPNFLVLISVREYSDWVVTPLLSLSIARTVIGALLLIFGLIKLCKTYIRHPGIHINPSWAPVFGDTVFVICMGVLSLGLLDYIWENWLGLMSLMEEAFQVTFAIMYLPCLIIFTRQTANMASQSLEVSAEGVTWYGPASSRTMAWENITGLDLRSTYVLVGRLGFFMPRRLMTKLVFKLGEQDDQELYEPGTRTRKDEILRNLQQHAPPRLRGDFTRIWEEW
jgi:hypothetical protein